MCVGLVTSACTAVVRFVRRVHVHVLLAVARVGETAIAPGDFTLERFLA